MTDMPIRVAVVSRNLTVRAGLVSVIAQLDSRVVVTDAAAVDQMLEPHDVAIYDLGAVAGVDAYEELRRLLESDVQVIGLVYDTQRETLPPLAGATSHTITLAVTPEQLMEVLLETTPARQRHFQDGPELRLPAGLSEREFHVVELIGAGLSNAEIAKEMYVSINSIKSYIRSAYRKMGVSDRQGGMLWALRHGLSGGPDRR